MKYKLNINIQDKVEIERFVLINIIGLLDSALAKAITIDDISTYIFNPFTMERLRAINVNHNILDIIEDGCVLEDIERLIPDILEKELGKLQKRAICELKKLIECPRSENKWLGEYEL